MTEQERINSETQRTLAVQDAKFATFMEELRQQREDMRRLQERQDRMQAKHDADIKEMNAKIDASLQTFTQQLHSNFVQTMIGVGAIMAAIGGLIIAALK